MRWIVPLSAADDPAVVGAKAHGLHVLRNLGLSVPPAFVLTTALHAAYRHGGLPHDLDAELTATQLDADEVSVRSGAVVSMPGMMSTVLNVRRTALRGAVEAVLDSWNSPRAVAYRALHDIPDDVGTAIVVQAMVHGDRDDRSASGVAFSRDPMTGAPHPYGEVVFRAPGVDVVSGAHRTRPLTDLAPWNPDVWDALRTVLRIVERHYRDVCQVEFTIESGRLWLLQVRRGGAAAGAAARIAVGLVDAGILTRAEAVQRVDIGRLPSLTGLAADVPTLTRGIGASPGLASGLVALTADDAVRLAAPDPGAAPSAAHRAVILVRPTTSPADLHGLAAAAGVITFRGGPTSHAAVVARSLGKPCVVGAREFTLREGTEVTIDGTTGIVAPGIHPGVTPHEDPAVGRLVRWSIYGLAEN